MRPIGRVWVKENLITGYVVFGRICIKFAGSKDNREGEEVILIYPSKKQSKQ